MAQIDNAILLRKNASILLLLASLALFSTPVEIEVHTVCHFKAPVNCKKGWKGLEDVRIFM